MREAFAHHSQRYGTRRLRAEVQAHGHAVGRWRIRRLLRAHGLRAQQPHSFGPRHPFQPSRVRCPQPLARPSGPDRPQPGVGGPRHMLAPARRRLAVPGRLARPQLAQNRGLGRA
ncbi:IS3 family transposase [Hymenobacter sp. BT635]|uniref:IS3 family transposase n=1 Tax=Hymenobacter nitidus TaxID=2880929 RepID=A0ABS8ALN4_9BACT|nr:IS3 family transposase [Hymenobacter nitidus]